MGNQVKDANGLTVLDSARKGKVRKFDEEDKEYCERCFDEDDEEEDDNDEENDEIDKKNDKIDDMKYDVENQRK